VNSRSPEVACDRIAKLNAMNEGMSRVQISERDGFRYRNPDADIAESKSQC
jgi:hypothetical protein